MEIRIKPLTPIWTGGSDGKMERIHETGIIGGLRWWYEAILRGLNKDACDPSLNPCKLDEIKYRKSRDEGMPRNERLRSAGLCDVCRTFGATGWKRRFRLSVNGAFEPAWRTGRSLNIKPPGRSRGWHLNAGGVNDFDLVLTGEPRSLETIRALILFLEQWGNLGARPQLGYGAFQVAEVIQDETKEVGPLFIGNQDNGNRPLSDLPDLRCFTFYKLRFSPRSPKWWCNVPGLQSLRGQRGDWPVLEELAGRGMVPVSPALKNHLRFEREWSSHALPHWLFGTLKGNERSRSKINFSWAYRMDHSDEWVIRGWVYLPEDAVGRSAGDEVRQVLQQTIGQPRKALTILGMRAVDYSSATMMFLPSSTPWRLHETQEVETMLQTVLPEAQQ